MRYPLDFWKGMFLAQGFIGVVYLFFGAFVSAPAIKTDVLLIDGGQVYKWYGQYAYSTITQVVQPTALQYVSNILALVAGWIATCEFFARFRSRCRDLSSLISVIRALLQHRHEDCLH